MCKKSMYDEFVKHVGPLLRALRLLILQKQFSLTSEYKSTMIRILSYFFRYPFRPLFRCKWLEMLLLCGL